MEPKTLVLLLAFILDQLIGDPGWLPHPTRWIGQTISFLERLLRPLANTARTQRLLGGLLVILVVGGSYLLTQVILQGAYSIGWGMGLAASVWLTSSTLATKELGRAAKEIYYLLQAGELDYARRKLSWIVGRDTDNLSREEIVRATVETVAENIVDAIISPLFYAFLGGTSLAVAYRAVNTLDSMLGYKNEKYLHFGFVAAKLDDLANYIPARMTGLGVILASILHGFDGSGSWQIWRRDASKHPSPNSGIPEAAVAGALGIRLGGLNYYQGKPSFRAYMGNGKEKLEPRHIMQTVKIMQTSAILIWIALLGLSFGMNNW